MLGTAFIRALELRLPQGEALEAYPFSIPAVRALGRLSLDAGITFFVGENGSIATHSPLLLAYPGARIYQFDADGIAPVAYEDTEHYAVTRDFLNHHGRRMAELLADDEG